MFVFKVAYILEKKERVTKQLSANYSIFVSKEDKIMHTLKVMECKL